MSVRLSLGMAEPALASTSPEAPRRVFAHAKRISISGIFVKTS